MTKSAAIVVILLMFVSNISGQEDSGDNLQGDFFIRMSYGFDLPTQLTVPVNLGIYLFDSMSIEGEHGTAYIEGNDQSQPVNSFQIEFQPHPNDSYLATEGQYTNSGIYLRFFPVENGSFYFLLAGHQRNYIANVEGIGDHNNDYDGEKEYEAKMTAKATVGTIGIGNRWIRDWFYFGADWLVIHQLGNSSVKITEARGLYVNDWTERAREYGKYINSVWSASWGVVVITFGIII